MPASASSRASSSLAPNLNHQSLRTTTVSVRRTRQHVDLNQEEVINYLSNLTVIDLVNLTKALEDKWGVKAAPVAVAAAGCAAAAARRLPRPRRRRSSPSSSRRGGANKIGVIKVVREVTGLGLKDAKDLVDGAPKDVKAGVNKAEADDIDKKLKEAAPKSRSSNSSLALARRSAHLG